MGPLRTSKYTEQRQFRTFANHHSPRSHSYSEISSPDLGLRSKNKRYYKNMVSYKNQYYHDDLPYNNKRDLYYHNDYRNKKRSSLLSHKEIDRYPLKKEKYESYHNDFSSKKN